MIFLPIQILWIKRRQVAHIIADYIKWGINHFCRAKQQDYVHVCYIYIKQHKETFCKKSCLQTNREWSIHKICRQTDTQTAWDLLAYSLSLFYSLCYTHANQYWLIWMHLSDYLSCFYFCSTQESYTRVLWKENLTFY